MASNSSLARWDPYQLKRHNPQRARHVMRTSARGHPQVATSSIASPKFRNPRVAVVQYGSSNDGNRVPLEKRLYPPWDSLVLATPRRLLTRLSKGQRAKSEAQRGKSEEQRAKGRRLILFFLACCFLGLFCSLLFALRPLLFALLV